MVILFTVLTRSSVTTHVRVKPTSSWVNTVTVQQRRLLLRTNYI